jgi:hypothetical protein
LGRGRKAALGRDSLKWKPVQAAVTLQIQKVRAFFNASDEAI